ncbi:RNA polymerase sigma factor [Pollutimonas thiosulfatoxidans]|uniref:RNA polymerase subunit sigma n=1 Tax=Pollutimonas thiosulfatoxidans TaxID=2028345 RepID=A0A410GGA6_9BURK|nr:RNA polymerase sigma factor [Pollutimonas thiosulfatoxidans]MBF6618128.1 RNA polymerase sigma factor [Candidimonas sp.]NYT45523.1 RNA polymerase sigma factor [Alcaligenaceae bacterium]QAA95310.1 RNA polymerase subunit sigma [Pollutimonas thiosulfatoxidans]
MTLTLVPSAVPREADSEIARHIALGDPDALTKLMRRYNQRLYRVARSILRNDADAEEAVQEAFFCAYRAMGQFRGESALSTWLVRIVVNESNRRLRKINRLSTWLEFNSDAQPDDMTTDTTMDEQACNRPEPTLLRAQTRQILEGHIDRLPDVFRSVFVLRAVEEFSVEETAACLGIPPATVRTRYFRARALLRKALRKQMDDGVSDVFSFAGDRCDRIVATVLARVSASS